jgi:hypothetical protein
MVPPNPPHVGGGGIRDKIHQIILNFFFNYSEVLTRPKAGKCAQRKKIKKN